MIEVVEAFRGYAPPCDVTAAVADLLESVPAAQVAGLRTVVLTNQQALTGRRKRGRSWHRGRKVRHEAVLGMYHQAWRGEPAWIELFVDQILRDTPRWALSFRFVRTIVLAPTLYHEVGHHIHRRHRPEEREPEDVADDWKKTLMRAHVRRRHPFVRRVLSVVNRLRRRPRGTPRV